MPLVSSRTPSLSAQLAAVDDAAFELVDRAIRVDDETGIRRAPHANEADALLDLDFGDDSGVRGHIFVAGEGDAAAAPGAGRQTRLPTADPCDMLDDRPRPRVGQYR